MQESAFLLKGLTVELVDIEDKKQDKFCVFSKNALKILQICDFFDAKHLKSILLMKNVVILTTFA